MGGGLMQLVAYGAQDIYLTGNPQITFFKVVYRRHTNFSMESIEQTWSGSSTTSGRCTATISRNGDLVSRMYLDISGEPSDAAPVNPGNEWIKTVELEIGGQRIDQHSGLWMETWTELTQRNDTGLVSTSVAATASGDGTPYQNMTGTGGVKGDNVASRYHVPLQFWFCRNPGLALPLIALQYHEVKVTLDHVVATTYDTTVTHNKLWVDYIYLDTDERRRFAQQSHEYLIEQVQEQSVTSLNQELNFNHPVKELVWTAGSAAAGSHAYTDLTPINATLTASYLLKLNGHDRFSARPAIYFSRVQINDHHSGSGGIDSNVAGSSKANDAIGVYSFALKPEEHQPSGTCNFSRIDNARLEITGGTIVANAAIFAVNYNVLRIMSGMGGLAYSN
jgi:hypothetical protein